MLINKITIGFVIQVFDTDKKEFVSQNFTAGDECNYEDSAGNPVESILLEVDGKEKYLPYHMEQPMIRYIQLFDNDGEHIGILKTNADEAVLDDLLRKYKDIESDDKGTEGFIENCCNSYPSYIFERFYLDDEKILEI